MKSLKLLALLFVVTTVFYSCSDDETPVAVNEEEVITTMTVTLTPASGTAVTLVSRDADGDGPNPAVLTVSGDLTANTTYTGTIKFENEIENEDITEEVEEESDEHQVIFTVGNGLNVTATATNNDGNGNPLGTQFSLVTTTASNGNLTFTLRHEPTKPNDGTLAGAGGETDIEATFTVTIQ